MGMEANKISAAILLALLIGMSTGFIADMLFHSEPLERNAYVIDTGAGPVEIAEDTGPPPIAPLLQIADIAAGETFAARNCGTCHTFAEGEPNRTGPNMWNVVMGPKAHLESFTNYSRGLRERAEAGEIWDYEALNAFLLRPRDYISGTSMTYAGIRNDQDRANVIAYLRSLSDDPAPLPEVVEEAPADDVGGEGDAAPADNGAATDTGMVDTPVEPAAN